MLIGRVSGKQYECVGMSQHHRGRILIDGYNLALDQGTGISTYARTLSYCAHELGFNVDLLYGLRGLSSDPLLQEIAFHTTGNPLTPTPLTFPGKVVTTGLQDRLPYFDRVLSINSLFEIASTRFAMSGKVQAIKPDQPTDLVHLTYPTAIRVIGARNICTIHDLVPMRLPYTTTGHKSRQLILLRKIAMEADHIVTVSECSRRDIIDLLDVSEEKVTNTYQTVTLPANCLDISEEQIKREIEGVYGLAHKGYFLFYGALEPKKNIGRLIEAHCGSGIDAPLVIVGKLGWLYDNDLRLIETVNKASPAGRPRVLRLDYVPQSTLISLIRGSCGVLFPSLYEGFGLPVLEAMQLGTPVMTSNVSSLPEIAGDAALLIDPYDKGDISRAIRALWEQSELRDALVQKGYVQAAKFSTAAYLARLDALYTSLLGPAHA
jgi:glycosyltransferase involved in cell wall biosynthesis